MSESRASYEAELARLRCEVDELAKAKKRMLAEQQEEEAAKEIQKAKDEISKLQEELCAIKAKQVLTVNVP